MKAAINELGPMYWASIKNGRFSVYDRGTVHEYIKIRGQIVGQYMKDDEYQGKKYRICLLHTVYEGERCIISVRTDSGYFRTLCNYLSYAKQWRREHAVFLFAPSYKEQDGKKISALFVQDVETNKWLKQLHTKETGTLPAPKLVRINNADVWDWSDVVTFYEQFIISTYPQGWPDDIEPARPTMPAELADVPAADPDDLPF
jgi:hypothetical protein